jgi:C4-dicarboxylate-specific signal transduction histidine kinase
MISIKNKIISSVVILVVLFGGMATIAVFSMTKDNLIAAEQENIKQHTIIHNSSFEQILLSSRNLVKSISVDEDVISLLEISKVDRDPYDQDTIEHITEHYLESINADNKYSALYIMNRDGLTVVSTAESFIGKNYGFREYFSSAMAGKPYTDISVGVTSKELGYYFSHPIKGNNGDIIGVAVAKMRPDAMNAPFTHFDSDKLNVMVTDSYGMIIFSKDDKKLLHSLGDFSKEEREIFNQEKRYGGIEIDSIGYSEIRSKLSGIDINQQTFNLLDNDENRKYIAVSKIGDFPFYVVTETEIDNLIAIAVKTSQLIAVFVLVAALVVAVFITILVSKIMKPLGELQKTVEKVSDGNLSERIDAKSKDEIGLLALSFNKMIDSIVEARSDVDKKVEEQTKDLIAQQEEAERIRKNAEEVADAMSGRELKMIELKKEIQELKKEKTTS